MASAEVGEAIMGDVGILKTTIAVESHQRRGDIRELADTLVYTVS